MSTTCNSKSACTTSSSVALNASTNPCGNFRMKPTVSVSKTFWLVGNRKRRVVGSSVANNLSSARTSAPVSALSKRGFAGVGVTDNRGERPVAALAAGALRGALAAHGCQVHSQFSRCARHSCGGRLPIAIRLRRRACRCRRIAATSGPRTGSGAGADVAICEFDLQLAFAVRARCAKISRISAVRSIILQSKIFSRLRLCAGESSSSKMTVSTSLACSIWQIPPPCPCR